MYTCKLYNIIYSTTETGFYIEGLKISIIVPPHICVIIIYIYKEELKTVVREFLACTQPNRHKTSTALWTPYRRVSLRGRRAQIRFSRGARGEKPENDRPPFWFYGESIRTSVHGSHNVSCGSAIIGMPSCVFCFFYGAP